jgi:glycosyltransferase involved in cell wall biosynthesis
MKILLVHNFYRSGAPGGEDAVFRQERTLLGRAGAEVISYERSNDEVDESYVRQVAITAARMAWSRPVYRELGNLLRQERPDIAHFHNTFPLISPSAYAACRDAGVPVVQTLHNYRLICSAGTFYRDGHVCEICTSRSPWAAVRHRCYRDSIPGSLAVAWMLYRNWSGGTFTSLIDRYIALSQFAAGRFASQGVPAERIVIKPNFVDSPEPPSPGGGGYAVFAARLSPEKGVRTLLHAWRSLRDIPLKIVGDGPMMEEMRAIVAAEGLPVEFLGMRPRSEVLEIIGHAELQVVCSEWFEGFPLVIVEAYARGTPVIASRIGSLVEIVEDGRTGYHFPPGDAGAMADRVRQLWSDAPLRQRLRAGARARFEASYTPEANLESLLAIYRQLVPGMGLRARPPARRIARVADLPKVMLVHNFYRSGTPGGEDVVVRQERELLEGAGVPLVAYTTSNDQVDEHDRIQVLRTAATMSWSRRTYDELTRLLRQERPDVAHFHNTFPLISPSAYAACRDLGVPVVQTLHNYRLVCCAGTFFREGEVCQLCTAGHPWAGVRHSCYRDSWAGSLAVAWMLRRNWANGTFPGLVDVYVTLSSFAAERFAAEGLPRDRIVIKPNFVDSMGPASPGGGGYAIFAARLSEEKGVRTLLEAWRQLRDVPLKIVGDGPLLNEMRATAARHELPVEFVGMQPRSAVLELIGRADLQVIASECFEGFPLVLVESYARGTPVVASRIGSLVELVVPGETGLHFEPARPDSLAAEVRRLWTAPELRAAMRAAARRRFESDYTPSRNLDSLLAIYERALAGTRKA